MRRKKTDTITSTDTTQLVAKKENQTPAENIRPLEIKIKKLHQDAKILQQAHEGDLIDFFALEDTSVSARAGLVRTGIAIELPKGYQLRIYNRSSNALKHGLMLANGVGIIDTGYRGEICGVFCCYPPSDYLIRKGDKIMQGELVKINDFQFVESNELSETKRNTGGFGSTGK